MNVKKAIKRIGALAAGTTMVTATIMGAAADLGEYPAPFVENYVFDGKIVVGATAATSDVLGAIDIATSLQAAAKSPAGSSSGGETVTVTGGEQFVSGSEDFNFGDQIDDFHTSGILDDGDMDLLADGEVEEDDGSTYEFEQTITVGDAELKYGQEEEYGDDPIFYLDLDGASNKYIVFRVEFKDTIDATALDDSETIEMFGKSFTFDPTNAATGDFTIFGSDVSLQVNQGEPVTVEVGGEEYTIEVLGGNSDNSEANIRVTGDGTSTKSLQQGNSKTMAGLEIYVEDVFINNIGENSIAVSLFVGSNKIVIPSASTSYNEIELNGEDDTEIFGKIGGTADALTDIYFRVDPTDFLDPSLDNKKWDWLPMGDMFVDPLFGFKLSFDGMSDVIENRPVAGLKRSGDSYNLMFTTNNGEDIDLEVYEATSATALAMGESTNVKLTGTSFDEEHIFILEDTETDVGDRTTYVFEVGTIDSGDNEFQITELTSGDTSTVSDGDELEDTGVFAHIGDDSVYLGSTSVNATAGDTNSLGYVVAEGGLKITLGAISSNAALVTFLEDSEDVDEAAVSELNVTITPDSSDDIVMTATQWVNLSSAAAGGTANDQSGDYKYGISPYGTWFDQERENSGEHLWVYYGGSELDFNVFLNSPDAVVVRSGSNDGNAYMINEIAVGAAVLDTDAMGLIGRDNLIVVGGPCINTVAMSLMGNPEVCAEGFTMGEGMLKFYGSQNALLVAGYSADDTLGAAYVLADYDSYALSGDEMKVITTDLTDLDVVAVE